MMQPTQGTFLGITPVSLVSNGLYFLTLPLVSVMRVIYTSKRMLKKFGVRVIYQKIRYIWCESVSNLPLFVLIFVTDRTRVSCVLFTCSAVYSVLQEGDAQLFMTLC